jgi:hypothetical protein
MTRTQFEGPKASLALICNDSRWWVFCLLVFALKFVLLAADPNPKLFMGDSGSYLWTALSGWIPPDRSFLYGYVIRWVSLSTHSLHSLLILQTFLAAATAILAAFICRRFFFLSPRLSYLAGFVCALDPLQLVWERYVMTETISLFFYVGVLTASFAYLEKRRLWQLVVVQLLAVLAISFRISYLLVVQASTLLLPILAFLPSFCSDAKTRIPVAKTTGLHLASSVFLMLLLHLGYKHINGALAARPPAYLYSSGLSILAAWAPILQPSDSPDARLAEIIAHGAAFHLTDLRLRNSQLYSPQYLIDRWKTAEPDIAVSDRVAQQTAMRALVRRPWSIFYLGFQTFSSYFHPHQIHNQAKSDLGKADWPDKMTKSMARQFRLAPPSRGAAKDYTLLQRYFLRAQPYYCVVVLSPLLCTLLFFFVRDIYVIVLFIHGCIFIATDSLFAVTASVRYLQPLSFLTILILILLANTVIRQLPGTHDSTHL